MVYFCVAFGKIDDVKSFGTPGRYNCAGDDTLCAIYKNILVFSTQHMDG